MTKEQLMQELAELRQRVAEIEKSEPERQRVEEALRESEKKYRLVVENINEAIVVAQDERFKFVNPKTMEILGYGEDELTSRPFMYFIYPDDRAMVAEKYLKRLRGEMVPPVYSFKVVAQDGRTKLVEVSTVAIIWDSRPATLIFLRDISERKRAEAEREKLVRDLQKTLAEVKTLKGILPICASCKKIRDDKGYWRQIEAYIRDHSEAEFSHGLCPDCAKKLYG